jgi:hypothetical protein
MPVGCSKGVLDSREEGMAGNKNSSSRGEAMVVSSSSNNSSHRGTL